MVVVITRYYMVDMAEIKIDKRNSRGHIEKGDLGSALILLPVLLVNLLPIYSNLEFQLSLKLNFAHIH